ncbi:MAG: precorrin-3B C(17)-methyltransferase [Ferrimicrobium sp.]
MADTKPGIVLALGTAPPGLASRLGFDEQSALKFSEIGEYLTDRPALVIVAAIPIVVRAIASRLSDKHNDAAIVALDEEYRFATVIVGAHHGGNQLAREVADYLGATPVITTHSDLRGVVALDQIRGLRIEATAQLQAQLNAGANLEIIDQGQTTLPPSIATLADALAPATTLNPVRVVVSDRSNDGYSDDLMACLPSLIVGLGSSTTVTTQELIDLITTTCTKHHLNPKAIAAIATIDRRLDLPAFQALPYPILAYTSDQLASVTVPTPSSIVQATIGTPSVAEAAALLGADRDGTLIVAKEKSQNATVAIARRARVRGHLSVVGIGPGALDLMTLRARAVIRQAYTIVGYRGYLTQIESLLSPTQQVLPFPIGAEQARVDTAIDLAIAGDKVALVTSGDPGTYAMAQLVEETLLDRGRDGIEVDVIPGVSAAYAGSAAVGAMLGHDHALISLSDLLTPWEVIEARIESAGRGDFVVALYNPRSRQRSWQLEKALAILGGHRDPATPVVVAKNVERPGARVLVTTLASIDPSEVDMETVVIVGSTRTITDGHRVVTPRGYRRSSG